MKRAGIYKIVNTVTGCTYIGQSSDMGYRKRKHKYELTHGVHSNPKMQNSFRKHGMQAFLFEELFLLETCGLSKEEIQNALNAKEKEFIQSMGTFETGFNLTTGGDGHIVSDATRHRLRIAHLGYCPSPETRAKLSLANKGKKMSAEAIRKTADALRGRKHDWPSWNKGLKGYKTKPASEERKRKISQAQMGAKNHNFGKTTPDSAKQKCRDSYHGTQCHLAKLDDEKVLAIKTALASGAKGSDLARQYAVTRTAISGIKTGKTWKHVQPGLVATSREVAIPVPASLNAPAGMSSTVP